MLLSLCKRASLSPTLIQIAYYYGMYNRPYKIVILTFIMIVSKTLYKYCTKSIVICVKRVQNDASSLERDSWPHEMKLRAGDCWQRLWHIRHEYTQDSKHGLPQQLTIANNYETTINRCCQEKFELRTL